MKYAYHSQYQALEKAAAIGPVPPGYPLRDGLWEGFEDDFRRLIRLVKRIYRDMAAVPQSYGLVCMDVCDLNHGRLNWGPIRLSDVSTRRAMDVLYAMAAAGTLSGHCLEVDGPAFRAALKEAKMTRPGPVVEALARVGIESHDYRARCEHFSVACPQNPGALRALKAYCDLRMPTLAQSEHIAEDMGDFGERFYTLDYRYTADLSALDAQTWVREHIRGWDTQAQAFYTAFGEAMRAFPKVRCAGDFFIGQQCIAKMRYEDDAWKHRIIPRVIPEYRQHLLTNLKIAFVLILPLRVSGATDRFEGLPPHLAAYMQQKKCQDCNAFAGRKAQNGGICPHTVCWTYEGTVYRSCSYYCFHFENPQVADIPTYVDMMCAAFAMRG